MIIILIAMGLFMTRAYNIQVRQIEEMTRIGIEKWRLEKKRILDNEYR